MSQFFGAPRDEHKITVIQALEEVMWLEAKEA